LLLFSLLTALTHGMAQPAISNDNELMKPNHSNTQLDNSAVVPGLPASLTHPEVTHPAVPSARQAKILAAIENEQHQQSIRNKRQNAELRVLTLKSEANGDKDPAWGQFSALLKQEKFEKRCKTPYAAYLHFTVTRYSENNQLHLLAEAYTMLQTTEALLQDTASGRIVSVVEALCYLELLKADNRYAELVGTIDILAEKTSEAKTVAEMLEKHHHRNLSFGTFLLLSIAHIEQSGQLMEESLNAYVFPVLYMTRRFMAQILVDASGKAHRKVTAKHIESIIYKGVSPYKQPILQRLKNMMAPNSGLTSKAPAFLVKAF